MLSQKAELGISNSSCAFIVLYINHSFKKIPERFPSVFTSEGFAQKLLCGRGALIRNLKRKENAGIGRLMEKVDEGLSMS